MIDSPNEKAKCDPDLDKAAGEDGSWEADQRKREYYYDDAHGYETFVDDDDEDDEENPPAAQARA
jgi:hypothetical protein